MNVRSQSELDIALVDVKLVLDNLIFISQYVRERILQIYNEILLRLRSAISSRRP